MLRNSIGKSGLRGTLTGTESGLNALVQFDSDLSATHIADRARMLDVCVSPIARYAQIWHVADSSLVLGYAAFIDANIEQA